MSAVLSALLLLHGLLLADPAYPEWAHSARLAGAYFEPDMSAQKIDKKLAKLAADGVSVVVADLPTGWSYVHLVDEARFSEVVDLMANRVAPLAHARGLKVVWYLTTLELIAVNGKKNGRDPGAEHPDWVQVDRHGKPVSYAGKNGAFWLEKNDIDTWVGPETPYRAFFLGRVAACAAAGADGLWFDVAYYLNSMGKHDDLWPSHDPYTAAAFQSAYGISPLPERDFEDPEFRRFVRFRQESILSFASAVSLAARAANPNIAVFFENWCMDSAGATTEAQDPLDLLSDATLATAHELSPVDQDDAGMGHAKLRNWLDYVTMVKFCAESNPGRPNWILSYAGSVKDSLRQAGVHVAEGANFYEAQGPEMVDDTTGSRPLLFPWIADQEEYIYGAVSLAEVALYYSPRTRDFVDRESGGGNAFQLGDTVFYREYRKQARKLLKRNIMFDVLTSATLTEADKARYAWLLLPAVECLSDAEAAWIAAFVQGGGQVAYTGASGSRDGWGDPRPQNALSGLPNHDPAEIESDVIEVSTAKNQEQRILATARSGVDGGVKSFVAVTLVHLGQGKLKDVTVRVRLPAGVDPPAALAVTAPDIGEQNVTALVGGGYCEFTVPKLKTVALAIIRDA